MISLINSELGHSVKKLPLRLFSVLCGLSLILMFVGIREGNTGFLHTVRGGVQALVAPVRLLGSSLAVPIEGFGTIFSNLATPHERLSDLKAENDRLKAENIKLTESVHENDRLAGLLQIKSMYKLNAKAARVISRSSDAWSSSVIIDQGTNSGIACGMPVVDAKGVIGQVRECGPTTSVVRLLSEEHSGVAAMIQSSRVQGQLVGSLDGVLRLTLIRTDQHLNHGDVVITSGVDGVFPKGLPLGTVENIEKIPGALHYNVTVRPTTSTNLLETVLVVTSVSEDQKASPGDVADANAQRVSPQSSTTTNAPSTSS